MVKNIKSTWIKILLVGTVLILIYRLTDNLSGTFGAVGNFVNVFTPVIIGAAISFFLWKPASKLELLFEKSKADWVRKRSRGLAVLLIYLIILAVLALIVNFIIPGLGKNIRELIENAPGYIKEAEKFLAENEILSKYNFLEQINEKIMDFVKENLSFEKLNMYVGVVSNIANSFMSFFLGIVFSIYILLSAPAIKGFAGKIYKRLNDGRGKTVIKTYAYRTVDLFYSYFSALALDAVIVGLITAIVLGIFKVPYAVLLGLFVAIGNMIPFFGPIVAAVVIYVITAIAFDPVKAIWVIVFQLVLGQLDGNLIQPKILGKSIGISPLLVLFSVVVFGDLFGFVGMIMGVPVIAAIKMIADDYLDNGKIDASV